MTNIVPSPFQADSHGLTRNFENYQVKTGVKHN